MWFHKPPGHESRYYERIDLRPLPYRGTQQDTYNWTWPVQTTQYGARMTEFWFGNQLPNSNIHIPGVPDYLWGHSRITNTQNTAPILTGGAYNKPLSIAQANTLMANAQNAWANRYGDL
jgi:hypothetical protein